MAAGSARAKEEEAKRPRGPALRGTAAKSSKKIGCKAYLTATVFMANPAVVVVALKGDHIHKTGTLASADDLWCRTIDQRLQTWILEAFTVVESVQVVYDILNTPGTKMPAGMSPRCRPPACQPFPLFSGIDLIGSEHLEFVASALTPPPQPTGVHGDDLANSRWHPTRETLRELQGRVRSQYQLHSDDLTSVQKMLHAGASSGLWYKEHLPTSTASVSGASADAANPSQGAAASKTTPSQSAAEGTAGGLRVRSCLARAELRRTEVGSRRCRHSCSAALWAKKYILVIQTDEQRQAMLRLQESGMLLHLDATGQTNSYNCPLFALLYYVRISLNNRARLHL